MYKINKMNKAGPWVCITKILVGNVQKKYLLGNNALFMDAQPSALVIRA
jgi:hypothetical protein